MSKTTMRPTCRVCGLPRAEEDEYDRPWRDGDGSLCWAAEEEDCLDDNGGDVWGLVAKLRAERDAAIAERDELAARYSTLIAASVWESFLLFRWRIGRLRGSETTRGMAQREMLEAAGIEAAGEIR